ncbi:MAG: sigma-70 family RNA polymerase sigma factor [Planctomycetes bacterium]|nr:sigma-70 family RNA polymerase sigma factor [Planctomycetota bacterium]
MTDLVQRHRHGDPEAAGELFAYYAQRLSRVAEQHLSRKLAGRVDGEDVVQSVFRTFFRRSARGDFKIDSSVQLWRLLVKITITKARAKGRYHTAAQRDVAAEQRGADEDWLIAAMDRDPGPEEAVMLMDEIEALLKGLPSLYCQVLELRLKGHSVVEVAGQVGISRQTVYRALELLQHRLKKEI